MLGAAGVQWMGTMKVTGLKQTVLLFGREKQIALVVKGESGCGTCGKTSNRSLAVKRNDKWGVAKGVCGIPGGVVCIQKGR